MKFRQKSVSSVIKKYDPSPVVVATEPVLTPGYLTVEKKPRYQEITLDQGELMRHFLYSLAREVARLNEWKQASVSMPPTGSSKELKKRHQHYDIYDPENNFYDRFIDETRANAVTALQEEVDALNFEIAKLQHQLYEAKQK